MTAAGYDSDLRGSARKTGAFAVWLVGAVVVAYCASGIYSVDSSHVGVLLRFGKVIDSAVPAGIHYALPWPVDRVIHVPVRQVKRITIDDFYEKGELAAAFRQMTGLSSYLITGDNNIVTVNCVLQYSISDPARYLFSLKDAERTLRSLACTTLIHSLSHLTIDDVLTVGKSGIQIEVKQELQRRLDEMETGLDVSFVELQEVRPPEQVQEYFNDVINAMIDKEKVINNALSYQNEKMPRAKADADRLVRDAEAYEQRVVTKAQGDAARFVSIHTEYARAPAVTRRRLHLEFLNETLPGVQRKTVVAQPGTQGLVRIVTPGTAK
ncbi:MAG: FtsH protease activity modulator HflK [Candidatus Eisenbacteria bacterium]|jgi:membrane protease subunit HflK|nr:FtsH protease activity modulator HflK [Candidatus Eisenbacteria bacterium]